MRATLVLAALIVAAPAVGHAQDATEARRAQAYDNLRQLEQNQRIGEVERQLSNMEARRQSEEALRALNASRPTTYVVPALPPVVLAPQPPQNNSRAAELQQTQRIEEVERQVTNLELRRQSEANLRALQAPAVAPTPYVVPGSSAATGVSPIGPRRFPAPAATEVAAAAQATVPAATDETAVLAATAEATDPTAAEGGLGDLELAASNARLREIAAAQRGR